MFNLALTKRSAKAFPPVRGSSGLILKAESFKTDTIIDDVLSIFGSHAPCFNMNIEHIALSNKVDNMQEEERNHVQKSENEIIQNIVKDSPITSANELKNLPNPQAKVSSKIKKEKKKLAKKSVKEKLESHVEDLITSNVNVANINNTDASSASSVVLAESPNSIQLPVGFTLNPITKDDNSIFRCFSKHFHGDQNGHHSARQKCVAFIRKNPEMFEKVINGNIQDYIDKHAMSNTLPDNPIYMALAASYKINLFIFDSSTKIMTKWCDKKLFEGEIYVICDDSCNYSLITKLPGKLSKSIIVKAKAVYTRPAEIVKHEEPIDDAIDLDSFVEIKPKSRRKNNTSTPHTIAVQPKVEIKVMDRKITKKENNKINFILAAKHPNPPVYIPAPVRSQSTLTHTLNASQSNGTSKHTTPKVKLSPSVPKNIPPQVKKIVAEKKLNQTISPNQIITEQKTSKEMNEMAQLDMEMSKIKLEKVPANSKVKVEDYVPEKLTNGYKNTNYRQDSNVQSRGTTQNWRRGNYLDYGSKYTRYNSSNNNNYERRFYKTKYYNNSNYNGYSYDYYQQYYPPLTAQYPEYYAYEQQYPGYYVWDPNQMNYYILQQQESSYAPPLACLVEHPEDNNPEDYCLAPVTVPPRYKIEENYMERINLYRPSQAGYFPVPEKDESTFIPTEGRFNPDNNENAANISNTANSPVSNPTTKDMITSPLADSCTSKIIAN